MLPTTREPGRDDHDPIDVADGRSAALNTGTFERVSRSLVTVGIVGLGKPPTMTEIPVLTVVANPWQSARPRPLDSFSEFPIQSGNFWLTSLRLVRIWQFYSFLGKNNASQSSAVTTPADQSSRRAAIPVSVLRSTDPGRARRRDSISDRNEGARPG
jgi:hypothetical protein